MTSRAVRAPAARSSAGSVAGLSSVVTAMTLAATETLVSGCLAGALFVGLIDDGLILAGLDVS